MIETVNEYEYRLDRASRPLFVAICKLDQPIAVTAAEFERLVREKYQSEKEIKPSYLYKWACLQGSPRALQKWLYSAAIDYLVSKHESHNILKLIPLERFVRHWYRPRVSQFIPEEAISIIQKIFMPNTSQLKQIKEHLDFIYLKQQEIKNKRCLDKTDK